MLQARIFARLARVAPPPADGTLLWAEFQELAPAWYGVFPPGWPLVLAAGAAVGAPWLVNPLLAASLPWLAWAAFRPFLPEREARVTAALAALSPGVLLLGGSMMSHTLTLACGLALVAALARPGLAGGLLGGGALGLMAATRPYDALLVGAPLGLGALLLTPRGRRAWSWLGSFVLAALLPTGLLLLDNAALTGDAGVFPVDAYFRDGTDWGRAFRPGCNRLGIGPDRGCAWYLAESGTNLAWSLRNLGVNAEVFDRLFLGFPGSALLALAGLPALARRAPALAAIAVLVPLGYALYWYHGVCYGARFWHSAYLAALPAAALALGALARWLPRVGAVLPAALVLGGLAYTLPPAWRELSDRYWCVESALETRLRAAGVDAGLVLLQDRGGFRARWPLLKRGYIDCDAELTAGAGLGLNDPWGEAPLRWLRWPGASGLEEVLAAHPGEPLYVLERDLPSGAAWLWPWDPARRAWGPRRALP